MKNFYLSADRQVRHLIKKNFMDLTEDIETKRLKQIPPLVKGGWGDLYVDYRNSETAFPISISGRKKHV
ncbi:MAG: hypothetical protein A2W23_00020 [Planctomycetes bacterium RBG_16_43_13]|nr:MAG: hypothetical protein A2W23_00020 [Planctomycetes bacterium RBG_16_43_13]